MKKLKKMKRLFAVLLTLVMLFAISVTAFATEGDRQEPDESDASTSAGIPATPVTPAEPNSGTYKKPTNSDNAIAIVNNVEARATVTAYRIVEPVYNANGFTGYKRANGITEKDLADILKPTSKEVTEIAARITAKPNANPDADPVEELKLDSVVVLTAIDQNAVGETAFKAELGAGYWVVIVTGSDMQKMYNPMLVGVYYSVHGSGDNNALVNGYVDATKKWSLDSQPAYAKSEKPTIDKKITGSTGKEESDGNESGNDVAIGDTVNFQIDTQIPAYSKAYKEVTVKITDTLGKGLYLPKAGEEKLKVYVGGTEVSGENLIEAATTTYTYTRAVDDEGNDTGKGFTISFDSEFALNHQGEKVFVTYDAVLGDDAAINFDANTNKATLEYTNDPNGATSEIDDTTYTYTFGIDASINGSWDEVTKELLKTGEEIVTGTTNQKAPLDGATFTLTSVDEDGNPLHVYTTISGKGEVGKDVDEKGNLLKDADGNDIPAPEIAHGALKFTGLDAGKYILQETKAPEGYSLNDAKIPVLITAEYDEDNGTLKAYTIVIGDNVVETETGKVSSYTMDSTKKEPEISGALGDNVNTYEIANTKLTALPSTGGIGTTIFTVAGCLIMILAAGLFFASRRKTAKPGK